MWGQLGIYVFTVFVVFALGCASGNGENAVADSGIIQGTLMDSGVADAVLEDAANPAVDARILVDAPPAVPDATILPDAPPIGGGIFCDETSDCESDHCCLAEICVRGDELLPGICIPN